MRLALETPHQHGGSRNAGGPRLNSADNTRIGRYKAHSLKG